MTDTVVETIRKTHSSAQSPLGLESSQVIHADGICRDALNAIEYSERAYEMLGGLPFVRLTGAHRR